MRSLFIKRLQSKDFQTARGLAKKWTVTDAEGKMYGSWINQWNEGWLEGQTIQLEDSQITSRLYNGKEYFDIVNVKKGSTPNQFGANIEGTLQTIYAVVNAQSAKQNEAMTLLTELKNQLKSIESKLADVPPEYAPGDEIPF